MRQCEGSFGEAYEKYTLRQESPTLFHRWTWISCVAVALGRKVWLDRGAYRIFPNHYIIIVAGTAQCRKSTAVGIGWDIVYDAGVTNMSAERITNASLWQQLGELSEKKGAAEMFSFADELRNYLSPEETHKGVITTLTRIYMCPKVLENRTKTAGHDKLKDCCLNILAATTPKDFSEIIPGGAAESGFVPRLHIVHQEVPRPRISEPVLEEKLKLKLIADLKHIHGLHGEMKLTAGAKAWFNDWYENVFAFPEDERLDGFYGRKHDYVLKLGIVLSAAERDDLVIEKEHLLMALEYLDEIEIFMPSMYEAVEVAPTLKYADSVYRHIAKCKYGATWSQLLRMQGRRLDAEGLADVCSFLESSGKVEKIPGKTVRGTLYKIRRGKNE